MKKRMENKMENKMREKKKHIISIAGDLASGKGTVSAILAKKLGYTIYKNGEYFRKLAKDHNMDVTEFNKYVPVPDDLTDFKPTELR